MGFDVIPKGLGVGPIIFVVYLLIYIIIIVYNGEYFSSCQFSIKHYSASLIVPAVVAAAVGAYNIISIKSITDENVNNTISICCNNNTYSNKCNFMEKYGCESLNITKYQYNEVTFNCYAIVIVFFCFCSFMTMVYIHFTRKMLENEGKITYDVFENDKLGSLKELIEKNGKDYIKERLRKNPNIFVGTTLICKELSDYYLKLNCFCGILSILSALYVGECIYELVHTSKIGFNLFSRDFYIIKLVFSIIVLIYSINFKRLLCKFKEKKKKGYDAFIYIIPSIIFAINLYIFVYSLLCNISNYSETYEKCCINHDESNKCNFLKENGCNCIDDYLGSINDAIPNILVAVTIAFTFMHLIINIIGSVYEYVSIENEKENRKELERLLIKHGNEDIVNEYNSNSLVSNI